MNDDLIVKIKKSFPVMSKSHKKIGNFIIEHSDKAAYLTATKLGETIGVSESTVVRFAIELGFKGYPEFQKSLKDLIRTNLTSVQRIAVADNIIGASDVVSKVLTSDMEKIKLSLEEVDRGTFEKAVELILEAGTIYITGARSAGMLADFLAYYFNLIFKNIVLIHTTSASELFEQMMHISSDDVLLAISFPRYSKSTVNAVSYAKKKGAKVIALTDSEISPIAQFSDSVLYAKSEMASFVDSLVAPLSIINALIVAVSLKNKNALSDTLVELEKIWQEFDVYETNN